MTVGRSDWLCIAFSAQKTLVIGRSYISRSPAVWQRIHVTATLIFRLTSMKSLPEQDLPRKLARAETLRNWLATALISFFIFLYGAALLGWLSPWPDERVIVRLEPIIFVLIG